MRSDLQARMRHLWRAAPAPDERARGRLERELLARMPVAKPHRWGRRVLGVGLGAALALGACALPTDYQAEVGHRLAIIADASILEDVDPGALANYLSEAHVLDELRVEMSVDTRRATGDDGTLEERTEVRIWLEAVGEDLEPDVLWVELQERFPALTAARLEDEELMGTVHGTLGGRLSHAWLDLEIDRHGVEEARARLAEELRLRGIDGQPSIEVVDHDDGDGRRRREVRVQIEDDERAP